MLSPLWEIVLIMLGLLTGVLGFAREALMIFHPPKADQQKVFFVFVRVAFALALILLYWNEHVKVKNLESQLSSAKALADTIPQKDSQISDLERQVTDLKAQLASRQSIKVNFPDNPTSALKQEIRDIINGIDQWIEANPYTQLIPGREIELRAQNDEKAKIFHRRFDSNIGSLLDKLAGRGLLQGDQGKRVQNTLLPTTAPWSPEFMFLKSTLKEASGLL